MDKKSETTKNTWLKKSYRRQIRKKKKKSLINNDKTEKNISFKKEKKKTRENLGEPFKPKQRSQICNPLNPRLELNQKSQFLTNLILINQSKSSN
jgi:hypothetical protein